jgi:hypothetical protein
MNGVVHITEAARQLGVTPYYLRMLEWQGRIPLPAVISTVASIPSSTSPCYEAWASAPARAVSSPPKR